MNSNVVGENACPRSELKQDSEPGNAFFIRKAYNFTLRSVVMVLAVSVVLAVMVLSFSFLGIVKNIGSFIGETANYTIDTARTFSDNVFNTQTGKRAEIINLPDVVDEKLAKSRFQSPADVNGSIKENGGIRLYKNASENAQELSLRIEKEENNGGSGK